MNIIYTLIKRLIFVTKCVNITYYSDIFLLQFPDEKFLNRLDKFFFLFFFLSIPKNRNIDTYIYLEKKL